MPVAPDRHHAELRVEGEIARRAGGHDDSPELARRVSGPAALQERAPDAEPLLVGAHHQLRELLHPVEANEARVSEELAVGLADDVAAVRLGRDELDQRALPEPVAADAGVGQRRVARDRAVAGGGVVHRALRERESSREVGGRPLPERELRHWPESTSGPSPGGGLQSGSQVVARSRSSGTAEAAVSPARSPSSGGTRPSCPSSAEARPKKSPTVQSVTSRSFRAAPGIIARW